MILYSNIKLLSIYLKFQLDKGKGDPCFMNYTNYIE